MADSAPLLEEGQLTVVVETVKQRKRCVGALCCLSLVLIVLLALLVPRQPALRFRALGATNFDALYADLKLESRAPVETKWDDLVVSLEWFTSSGSVDVATFQQSSAFKTPAFGSRHVFPGVQSYDALSSQLEAFVDSCRTEIVRIRFKGHVKTGDTKYIVRTPWVYEMCYDVNDGF